METYTADSEGRIPVPGVQALYPPGTKVFYQNGEYAGHETPVVEEAVAPEVSKPAKKSGYPPVNQVEGAQNG
jgi:hypothetical protein